VLTIITIPADKSVLIVEDNEIRLNWFREKLAGMKYTTCSTPQKALNVLGVHRFDVVFLDHDAVPLFVDPSDPNHDDKTFFRVAQLLARNGFDGTVVIHSGNPVGAERMAHLLEDRGNIHVVIAPFGSFDITVTCVRD
jgi:hypothetical protein